MAWLGAIFINRGEATGKRCGRRWQPSTMVMCSAWPRKEHEVKSGRLQPAKAGAAYLASRGQALVIPVGITNSDTLFANVKRLKISRIEVFIGEPYHLPDIGRRARSADLAAYTHLIMVKIAALLPERYHGIYKRKPGAEGFDCW